MEGPLFRQCCGTAAYHSQEQRAGVEATIMCCRDESFVLVSTCFALVMWHAAPPVYRRDYQLLPANTTGIDQYTSQSTHIHTRYDN